MTRHIESRLQITCVRWFRMQYQRYASLLFAVPNGGARSLIEAAIMKSEGVTAGVSDLLLLVPNAEYHGLCIEMKTESKGSRQRPTQIAWQKNVETSGYKYAVCRTYEEFVRLINGYMDAKNLKQ